MTITDSSGKVVGTGALSDDSAEASALQEIAAAGLHVSADLLTLDIAVYSFTATVPGGLDRYEIKVGRTGGTIYETAAQMKAPSLTLGSLSR